MNGLLRFMCAIVLSFYGFLLATPDRDHAETDMLSVDSPTDPKNEKLDNQIYSLLRAHKLWIPDRPQSLGVFFFGGPRWFSVCEIKSIEPQLDSVERRQSPRGTTASISNFGTVRSSIPQRR